MDIERFIQGVNLIAREAEHYGIALNALGDLYANARKDNREITIDDFIDIRDKASVYVDRLNDAISTYMVDAMDLTDDTPDEIDIKPNIEQLKADGVKYVDDTPIVDEEAFHNATQVK